MKKVRNIPYLMPKPVALIGATIDAKPNFFTVADLCTTAYKRFVISSGKTHYTNIGIIKNEAFSVTIPSKEMIVKTDYCGIKSGKKVDKSNVFKVFYSENLKTAPLIKEAPISHACKLVKTIDFGDTHYLFIRDVIESYVNEDCWKENIPDFEKVQPFSWFNDNYYRDVGQKLSKAYEIGKKFNEH